MPVCSGDRPDRFGVNRWIGGPGHELGHTFNLPHPAGCDQGNCTGGQYAYNSLMYVGYTYYPNTYLLDENKTQLLASGFFVATSTNPIDDIPYFVRQQYLDFFSREPDSTGYTIWQQTLGQCPNGGYGEFDNPSCDRVHVSAAFYQSPEFQGRGYFVYRFYQVGLGRRPTYAEFVPDMVRVGGSQSPEQEAASKTTYTNDFIQRAEFTAKYTQPQFQEATAYVRELERVAGVVVANEAQLISSLQTGTKTRADVMRAIAESTEVFNKYYNQGFVAIQYFGYLRRDPDTVGFNNWVQTITATNDYRHMIFGFMYSSEYRSRFGNP